MVNRFYIGCHGQVTCKPEVTRILVEFTCASTDYADSEVPNVESMGLDTVEIVLRTEETFNIDLPDDECGKVITVGDLYRLVLSKLKLPYVQAKEIEAAGRGRNRSHLRLPSVSCWSPPDVWLTLRGIIVDQLQVDEKDVKEEAGLLRDLGCD